MEQDALVAELLTQTSADLQRNAGSTDGLRAAVFLFLNRAYEAALEPDLICDLLGVAPDNILNRAGLSKLDEAAVMDAYATLNPILEQQHKSAAGER
jgi:hypothetical protein